MHIHGNNIARNIHIRCKWWRTRICTSVCDCVDWSYDCYSELQTSWRKYVSVFEDSILNLFLLKLREKELMRPQILMTNKHSSVQFQRLQLHMKRSKFVQKTVSIWLNPSFIWQIIFPVSLCTGLLLSTGGLCVNRM